MVIKIICIEGPGVGKNTLSELIAKQVPKEYNREILK